jgi:hypothetical protein
VVEEGVKRERKKGKMKGGGRGEAGVVKGT